MSRTHKQNINFYNDYYDKPSWWFRFRYDTQIKRATCLDLVNQAGIGLDNQCVLEIGFGSGAVLFSFKPSCEIYGLELSRSAIQKAEKKAFDSKYKKSKFVYQEGEKIPFNNNLFSVVIASHVLEHVENDYLLLAEINRVLQDDGVGIVLIPINETYDDPNHVRRYTTDSFIKIALASNFRVLSNIENELLFNIVRKFYYEKYNYRWRFLGPVIALLFNVPSAMIPYSIHKSIDKLMQKLGYKPLQAGFVLRKRSSLSNTSSLMPHD